MKILLGTPVHESKDYSMDRWMKCISELDYPYDLLLVDNTPGVEYVKKLKEYCENYNIKNYKIEHIEINKEENIDFRVAEAREIIRDTILNGKYDAWFTLECDVIVPSWTLTKMIELIDGYVMINHVYPERGNNDEINIDFGCSLITREALEVENFKYQFGTTDPLMPNCYHGGERWFMRRILRRGLKYHDVYGVISPIFHLAE